LYVITSESDGSSDVAFQDQVSRRSFTGKLNSGRAAMLLVGEDGNLLAAYNWK